MLGDALLENRGHHPRAARAGARAAAQQRSPARRDPAVAELHHRGNTRPRAGARSRRAVRRRRRHAADPAAVALVPEQFARQHMLAPLAIKGPALEVLQANPFDVAGARRAASASSARPISRLCATARTCGICSSGATPIAATCDSLVQEGVDALDAPDSARRDRGFAGRAAAGARHQRCDRQGRHRPAHRAGGPVRPDPAIASTAC